MENCHVAIVISILDGVLHSNVCCNVFVILCKISARGRFVPDYTTGEGITIYEAVLIDFIMH